MAKESRARNGATVFRLVKGERRKMTHKLLVSGLIAAATLIVTLAVTKLTADAAPHDGPGFGCETHIGWTYADRNGRVHADGSGVCNSRATRSQHSIFMVIERDTVFGWLQVGGEGGDDAYPTPPFNVGLPISAKVCPGIFRGRITHHGEPLWPKKRFSNRPGC
jgi:hypothetical protein